MTHIIIHRDNTVRERYLLKLLSYILDKEITLKNISTNPDIHILNNENSSIGIEDVKNIQKDMQYKPFSEKSQICIVYNCEKLTVEAQNAFLKTLEEQSETTEYILLLSNEKLLLDTILSRGIKHLVKEKGEDITISKPSILSLSLDEKFKTIEELSSDGNTKILELLTNLQNYFKSILEEKIREGEDIRNIQKNIELVQTAYERIQGNGNKRLTIENLFIQMK